MKKTFVCIAFALVIFTGAPSLYASGAMGVVRTVGQAAMAADAINDVRQITETQRALQRQPLNDRPQQDRQFANQNSLSAWSNYSTHQKLARDFYEKEEWDNAIAEYTLAILALRDVPDCAVFLQNAYRTRGSVYEKKGDHDKAAADYEAARAVVSDSSWLGHALIGEPIERPPIRELNDATGLFKRITEEEEPPPDAPAGGNADFRWSLEDLK